MASRRERRQRANQTATQRTATAQRVGDARTEVEQRALHAAAERHGQGAPLFRAVALHVGLVPEPAVFTQPTTALPTVKRRSLLGLDDNQETHDA